ncbi:class I SAM-dependent methyltransferase [Lascolabacillus massiliensis]|uniref:class I SAM-dependent methyltransferase n=1 Tax=Lascolabacillus massiliensis TaxID=1627894 RepID=UPI0006B370B0|nr:methyltransferase domain-containing protein [Lascolabacillus massiliensis]
MGVDIIENIKIQLIAHTLVVNAKLNNKLYDSVISRIKERDKKTITEYFSNNSEYYLQIGCGFNVLPNWLNSDIELNTDQVIYLDANDKFIFKNETFQFIFSEHLIEHLEFNGAVNLLSESYRVLKIGGRIRVATPDMSFLHNLFQDPDNERNRNYVEWSFSKYISNIHNSPFSNSEINHVYVINNFHRAWEHQIIFTYETLKHILEVIGFKNVEKKEVGMSDISELVNIERHSSIIPHEFNLMETMVLEAVK